MHDLTQLKVGDRFPAMQPSGRSSEPATRLELVVTDVASRYLTAQPAEGNWPTYRIERKTGRQKSNYLPVSGFASAEALDQFLRIKGLKERVERLARNISYGDPLHWLTEDQLTTLVELLTPPPKGA